MSVWLSGLKRQIANLLYGVSCTESSNLSTDAIICGCGPWSDIPQKGKKNGFNSPRPQEFSIFSIELKRYPLCATGTHRKERLSAWHPHSSAEAQKDVCEVVY